MWRSFSLLSDPFPSALSLGFCVFGTRFNVSNAKLRRMLSAEHCFSVTTLEMVACRQGKKHALNTIKYRAYSINFNFWSLCGVEIWTFCCTAISKAVEMLFWQKQNKKTARTEILHSVALMVSLWSPHVWSTSILEVCACEWRPELFVAV